MNTRLRNIGRDLRERLQGFFEAPLERDATALELMHAALQQAEALVQPAGRGRRLFPYTRLEVTIRQPGADRAAVDSLFADFDARLHERLAELNCETRPVRTSVTVLDEPDEAGAPVIAVRGFSDPVAPAVTSPAPDACPAVRITVEKGTCSAAEYLFEEPLIAIGRTSEPTDVNGQMRCNHVAFEDTRDGISETVGRAHARLELDRASGHYYLFNEGSSNPTALVRGGRMFRVAPRDPRGVRVRSGDQVQLGRALLRITLEAPP